MAGKGGNPQSHAAAAARRRVPIWLPAAILVGMILLLGGIGVYLSRDPVPGAGAAGSAGEGIVGRWVRPDGNYVLVIRSVGADGKADAGYFNPSPINVAKAEVTREGEGTKVVVELRDDGYEGSYYTLAHDPKGDRLVGVYHRRGGGASEDFEVAFVRMK